MASGIEPEQPGRESSALTTGLPIEKLPSLSASLIITPERQ